MSRRGSALAGCISASAACVIAVVIAACGGKVDGGVSQGFSEPSPAGTGRRPGGGSGSTKPGRPAPAPVTAASIASEIASTYCKTFSSCCVGAGEPPIDVSRCRELTSTAVEAAILKSPSELDNAVVESCISTIRERTAACGKEDLTLGGAAGMFRAATVAQACVALTGMAGAPVGSPCTSTLPCTGDRTCAVDACVSAPGLGEPCLDAACLDTAICVDKTCRSRSTNGAGVACARPDDCQLGLVCFKGECAPGREHPDVAQQSYSPYRVGADTCKLYTYL